MTPETPASLEKVHRFLDESGDTTFFGKGGQLILGSEGVSLTFGMTIVRIDRSLAEVRSEIIALQKQVETDPLLNPIPSVVKRAQRLVLNIAERGSSTRAKVLDDALAKATGRAGKRWVSDELHSEVVFNIQTPSREPLLNVADYLGWTVQRVFEKGETRFYDYLRDRIRLVVDLYDSENYPGNRNYYDHHRNPLTAKNKTGPPST